MLSNFPNKEILQICEVLAEQEHLKVTVHETAKGAMTAGFGALAGGLLGGPIGLAIGGSIGSISAAWFSKGKYRSVIDILRNDLTPQQKNKLSNSIKNILQSVKPEDCIKLLVFVLTNTSVKEAVIKQLGTFLLKEMSLQMVK